MKNKKIIFLVATVCCLAVCWFCFGAWSIADTDLTINDFTANLRTCYLYLVPSSNIASSEFSNVSINTLYTSASNYTTITAYAGNLGNISTTASGFYRIGWGTFSNGVSVELAVSVSSVNSTIGNYFISAAYIFDTSSSLSSVSLSTNNYIRHSFSSSDYRTLIVFVDKSASGGVSQEEYDDVVDQLEQEQLLNDQLYNDNLTLQEDLTAMRTMYNQVSQQLAQAEHDFAQLEIYTNTITDSLAEARTENAELNRQVEELQARIDSLESGGNALDFIGTAFEKVGDILQIEILPNITIGTIVAVPLILGVVFLVLRLVRGE